MSLEIELKIHDKGLAPGDYQLKTNWDWTPFETTGILHLRPLSDFKDTRVDPASQNVLLAQTGKVPITLHGDDFEFTKKLEIERVGDEFATPEAVRFLLPKGPNLGPQESMDAQIDTSSLNPGPYKLLVTQQDGKTHAVIVQVLTGAPRLDNLPILLNQGVTTAQHYVLKGERLNLLAKLKAPNAALELGQVSRDGKERNLTVHLDGNPAPGAAISIEADLTDRAETLSLADALQITGPVPAIASSQLSVPKDLDVAVLPNEFPAGYTLTAVLDVRNVEAHSQLRLACADDVGMHAGLQIGAQSSSWSLQRISPDQLFLSFDTGGFPAGCMLTASLDNGPAGHSQPVPIARLIRLPRILSIAPAGGSVMTVTTPADPKAAAVASTAPAGLRTLESLLAPTWK